MPTASSEMRPTELFAHPVLQPKALPPAHNKHTCQMVSQLAMVTEDAQFVTTGENGLRKQTLK